MGKMKELFMRENYPNEDLEREYLINDSLAKDAEYEEYISLQKELKINVLNSKIEVSNGSERNTRIEINQEENTSDKHTEAEQTGFQPFIST